MKELFQKVTGLLTAGALLTGVLCLPAQSLAGGGLLTMTTASAGVLDGMSYTIEGGLARIYACQRDTKRLVIPAELDGCPVIAIDDGAFSHCTMLTELTLPAGLRSIGEEAFENCSALTAITLPDSIREIGKDAFVGCDQLYRVEAGITYVDNWAIAAETEIETAVFPEGTFGIAYGAFSEHKNLTTVSFPESLRVINESAFNYCDALTEAALPSQLEYLGDKAFIFCRALPSANLPASLSYLGESAFFGCSALESATISDGIDTISPYLFANCRKLTAFTIPNSVQSIGDGAFESLENLTELTIPDSVTTIGAGAFSHCYKLAAVRLPLRLDKMEKEIFRFCKSLTSLVVPDGVTEIGDSAFEGCKALTEIDIPRSVTSLGAKAFYDCTQLGSVYIPPQMKELQFSTFYNCENLNGILLPPTLEKIANNCFSNCKSLTAVSFPETLTVIESGAFYGCTMLAPVVLPDTLYDLGENAFTGCTNALSVVDGIRYADSWVVGIDEGITTAQIRTGTRGIATHALENAALQEIDIPDSVLFVGLSALAGNEAVEETVEGITYVDNWVMQADKSLTTAAVRTGTIGIYRNAFGDCAQLTSVSLPEGLGSIGMGAFAGCESLSDISIPASVLFIGTRAFYNCEKMTQLPLPQRLDFIASAAFSHCSSLTAVAIPDNVKRIEAYAFEMCYGMETLTFGANTQLKTIGNCAFDSMKSLTEIVLPDSVTEIGTYLFSNCTNLKSAVLPTGLTAIPPMTFQGCKALTTVTLPDSVKTIGEKAFYSCTSLTDIGYRYSTKINDFVIWGKDGTVKTFATQNGFTYHHVKEAAALAKEKQKNYFWITGNIEKAWATDGDADKGYFYADQHKPYLPADELDGVDDQWKGSCYGMASVSALVQNRELAVEDFTGNQFSKISEIKRADMSLFTKSFVNSCWATCGHAFDYQIENSTFLMTDKEMLTYIEFITYGADVAVLTQQHQHKLKELGDLHAVVCFGMEFRENAFDKNQPYWNKNGINANVRILINDVNIGGFNSDYCYYVNTETGAWRGLGMYSYYDSSDKLVSNMVSTLRNDEKYYSGLLGLTHTTDKMLMNAQGHIGMDAVNDLLP